MSDGHPIRLLVADDLRRSRLTVGFRLFLAIPHLIWLAGWLSLGAWLLMSIAYLPMLRLYGQSPLWAPLLPLIALFYLGATLDSARRHRLGKGGEWKGRVHSRQGA